MSLNKTGSIKRNRTDIIAVCGLETGMGVTSLAVALAVMATCGIWRKVILIEIGNQQTFSKIRRFYDAQVSSIDATFRIDRIEFMSDVDVQRIMELSKMKGAFIVLDCGSKIEEYESFLGICTRKILLCSLLPWKIQSVEWMLQHGVGDITWDTILVTTGKKQQTRIRKKTGHKMKSFVNIEDPFALSVTAVQELYKLACESKYITTNGRRTKGKQVNNA